MNRPLVFPGGIGASPVAGFTVRMIVDRHLVLNEVKIHGDAILPNERSEAGGRQIRELTDASLEVGRRRHRSGGRR